MAGDPFKHVQAGAPLVVPAAAWNAFCDVALAYKRAAMTLAERAGLNRHQAGIALIKNDSGGDLVRFSVLGIDDVFPTSAENIGVFKNNPRLNGTTPTTASHLGTFAVMIGPAKNQATCRAVVSGIVVCKVYMHATAHRYADVKDADASQLESGDSGHAIILWAAPGVGSQWAVVHLGGGTAQGGSLWGKAPGADTANAAWVNDATPTGNGCYVNVNPCNRTGGGVIAAVTHKVWLPRNGRREDPNVRETDVISYAREAGGDFVAPSGLLDGKVDESIRIWCGTVANIPAGWTLVDQGKFYVGLDDGSGSDYPNVGDTGGFKLHGGDDDGGNNHDDHTPTTTGSGSEPGYGGTSKGFVDGSFEHTETDNRPPYIVRAWIKRTD